MEGERVYFALKYSKDGKEIIEKYFHQCWDDDEVNEKWLKDWVEWDNSVRRDNIKKYLLYAFKTEWQLGEMEGYRELELYV